MDFKSYLDKYNQDLEPIIEEVFSQEKQQILKIAPLAGSLVDDYKDFLSRGKKLRGAEIFLGYEMFGGKDRRTGLIASLVIEIVHAFLLIHDDIMDQDELRRGKPTMHKKYAQEFGAHYGVSMAIDVGDEGLFLAFRLLNSLNLEPQLLSWASRFLSQLLMEVGLGQALDLTYEREKKFTEEAVLQVHRYKTAEYTISGPLSIGAILAGADSALLKPLKKYGIPVGIAFQLRDDELGMFSTQKQLGKPVDSDLREGKVTILIVKGLEKAHIQQKLFLQYAHQNKDLTKEEVEEVREILTSCGALEYSRNLSRRLIKDGKKFIPDITKDVRNQKLLSQLADFVIEREN